MLSGDENDGVGGFPKSLLPLSLLHVTLLSFLPWHPAKWWNQLMHLKPYSTSMVSVLHYKPLQLAKPRCFWVGCGTLTGFKHVWEQAPWLLLYSIWSPPAWNHPWCFCNQTLVSQHFQQLLPDGYSLFRNPLAKCVSSFPLFQTLDLFQTLLSRWL